MLGHGRSPLWGPWPTVAAEDANVTKSWAFLKDSAGRCVRGLVVQGEEGLVARADIYVRAPRLLEPQLEEEALELAAVDASVARSRRAGTPSLKVGAAAPPAAAARRGRCAAEKKAVVGAIKNGFLAEGGAGAAFASRSKDVLQFASFVLDEALVAVGPKGDATQVLEPVVSIDQKKRVLTENPSSPATRWAEQARRPIELTVRRFSEPDGGAGPSRRRRGQPGQANARAVLD